MTRRPRRRAGFTLAEVAVTLVIVGIGLTVVLQGIITAKMSAAHTNHRKVARGLALLTLGQLESGLFWEELDGDGDVLSGTYADEGYEDFSYELVLGDEEFTEYGDDGEQNAYHDSWQSERDRRERLRDDEDEEDEDEKVAEPFEKVRIKVVFPKLGERPNELVLEHWIPWQQVYGSQEIDGEPPKPAGEEAE